MKARRSSKIRRICAMKSAPPDRAVTEAYCAMEVGLLVVWLCIAPIAFAMGSGAAR